MKIALAQLNSVVGDIHGNIEKILQFARRAKEKGAELIIFPEMTISGYPPGDLLLRKSFIDENLAALDMLKNSLDFLPAIVGYVERNNGRGRPLYNACAFLKDGKIQARQYKTLLPTYDVFDEDRYFEPAKSYQCIELDKIKFGVAICEDAWSTEAELQETAAQGLIEQSDLNSITRQSDFKRAFIDEVPGINGRYYVNPMQRLAAQNPDFIINIAASPFSAGKHRLRENLLRYHALRLKTPLIFVNQVGGNDELIFDGRSFVADAQGNIVACAKAFEEDLLIVEMNGADNIIGPINLQQDQDKWEIYRALVMGTGDYVRKCGFEKVVLGMSGGIDSSVVAAIACKSLGAENVLGVCMPSPYSSAGSVSDSQALAKNLNMPLINIPIGQSMNQIEQALSESFSGQQVDVTEENIQARLRGLILMSISNKFKRMLLTTGNKSELAVGYCTLYGDMCGGLAVISDLPKMQVYELAALINEEAGRNVIPEAVLTKPPSAELRVGQKDADSLPEYEILDGILQLYLVEGKTVNEIISAGYAPEIVAKIIRLVERNEFKRRQAAPGLKLTKRAFGVGWRMPIAQHFHEC